MDAPNFSEIVKQSQLKNLKNGSIEKLLDADPYVLKGVTSSFVGKLKKDNIFSVRDLVLSDTYNLHINPSILKKLYCLLFNLPSYDPGPPCSWEQRFKNAPITYYQTHPSNLFRIDFCPVFYRGRLNGTAKILIVGQDPSTDEILAQRVFVGRSGQRVQGLLRKLGVTHSYVMLNAFIYGIFNQFNSQMEDISLEPTILNYRNNLFDRVKAENHLELIISFGNGAEHAVNHWPGRAGLTWIDLTHPAANDNFVANSWNAHLNALHTAITPDDSALLNLTPYPIDMAGAEFDIPRTDLPFGIPIWHGTGGTRSNRSGNKIINWTAP